MWQNSRSFISLLTKCWTIVPLMWDQSWWLEQKKLMKKSNALLTRPDLKNMQCATKRWNANVNKNAMCDRTHSQYGSVAIIRASIVFVNKEVWKTYLEKRAVSEKGKAAKEKTRKIQLMLALKRDSLRRDTNALNFLEKNSWKMGITSSLSQLFFCRGLQRIFVMAEVLVLLKVLVFLKTMWMQNEIILPAFSQSLS